MNLGLRIVSSLENQPGVVACKSSKTGKRLNLLFHCLVKKEPERIMGWGDVLFVKDG